VVRLRPKVNGNPYPVISLALDNLTLTACANDYGYKNIFSIPLNALGLKNYILIGFLGNSGRKAKAMCDLKYIVPSKNVERIQETHTFLDHLIFELV
jgi:phosphoheptose isomerase